MIEGKSIGEVAALVQQMAVEKGFHEGPVNIDQKLLLAISEIVEAQDEIRNGRAVGEVYTKEWAGTQAHSLYDFPSTEKPEGFVIEIADAIIRLLQLSAALGLDIEKAMAVKIAYNATRPFKHGKAF